MTKNNPFILSLYTFIAAIFILSPCSGSGLKADEKMIFFPTYGRALDSTGLWEIFIHGWVFEENLSSDTNRFFQINQMPHQSQDDENPQIFKHRIQGFMVDNERRKKISLHILDQMRTLSHLTRPNGHVEDSFKLRLNKAQQQLALQSGLDFVGVDNQGKVTAFKGTVYLLPQEGWSVISDIDDTIKISNVRDKKELFKNTFYRPFQVVPGMAELYRQWTQQPGANIHYVSAAPWQLYAPLSQFFQQENFPLGTYHMKFFRWKDSSFFNLFQSPITYKMRVIQPLLTHFPRRKFILVGDSGEKDPEVYGELARLYPRQIIKIFIRNVSDEQPHNKRMQAAFINIEPATWQLFADPKEIQFPEKTVTPAVVAP